MASVRDELQRIYDTNGGELTPESVVKAARPKNAPLHNRFEWDNRKAGHAYRLIQAGELIRECRIVYARDAEGAKTVREYTSTREAGAPVSGVYKKTDEVLRDPVSRAVLLRNLERELAELERRYGHLVEFGELLRNTAGKRSKAS